MNILVSGSLAYDRIMDFPDRFSNHILPDKIHILNVCFVINELKENFGGTAGNIAYALALLEEKPTIVATAGRDFDSYKKWLIENNISTEHITIIEDELTAGAYITTDKSDNQITAFNPGAMKYSANFDFGYLTNPNETIAIIAPGNLDDMLKFSRIYKEKKIYYIFDPGQSLPAWSGKQLLEMLEDSWIFICNDYELELTKEKTDLSTEKLLTRTNTLIATKGEYGSVVMYRENGEVITIEIPPVLPGEVKDPTGAGDAYRAGLIKGLIMTHDIEHAAKMGSVCAAYSVEAYGTQTFHFTRASFNERFEAAFGTVAW
jgi:adenosine kinase